jgi:E3 ubiquitin-protein ligase DOA10
MLNFKVPCILSSTWIASIYIEPGMVFIARAVELLVNFCCLPVGRQVTYLYLVLLFRLTHPPVPSPGIEGNSFANEF